MNKDVAERRGMWCITMSFLSGIYGQHATDDIGRHVAFIGCAGFFVLSILFFGKMTSDP